MTNDDLLGRLERSLQPPPTRNPVDVCLEALDHVEAAHALMAHWAPAQEQLHVAQVEIEHHLGELALQQERKRRSEERSTVRAQPGGDT